MERDSGLDFNFWPSFADLMLALVIIMTLVLFLTSAVLTAGSVNLKHVEEQQEAMIKVIAESYKTTAVKVGDDETTYGISSRPGSPPDLLIHNEPTLQRITFSDNILFEEDRVAPKPGGEKILRDVATALKSQLSFIKEIQIQGHADNVYSPKYKLNIRLAAERAITIFQFFQGEGIDPAEHLMSVTSFGEFRPVARKDDEEFNRRKLDDANADQLRGQNRRIELLLFYRR